MTRIPAVAGRFYAEPGAALKAQIEWCYTHELGPGSIPRIVKGEGGKRPLRGYVVPHAGYVYSGPVAAHAYHRLALDGLASRYVIFGPNHTGYGAPVALSGQDWETPLGRVTVDHDTVGELERFGLVVDESAHAKEHSIEVQVPFLQHLHELAGKPFSIVPVCLRSQNVTVAEKVGANIRRLDLDDTVVLASTDFAHYVPQKVAEEKDRLAIEKILANDPPGLFETIRAHDITMCGYGPVMTALYAVRPAKVELLKHATSGDVHPMPDVVGYASLALT